MKRVLLDIGEDLHRVALVEDGTLVELYYESKRQESLVGNVYVGRVEQVVPNLQACFVEIGAGKKGYLYYGNHRATSDETKNENKPKVGDSLIVQVEKDAQGNKGAVLTKNISFAGKFLVLTKEDGAVGVSRKLTDEEERNRIRDIVTSLLPEGYSAIVRTNGAGKTEPEFAKEVTQLLEKSATLEKAMYQKPPLLLVEMNQPIAKAVRDFYGQGVEEFVLNDKESYELLLESDDFNGEHQPHLQLYEGKMPLFAEYMVESQSQKALEQKVWLKSGGFLVIEETEACVVVDVNSGKASGKGDLQKLVKKTNVEAAVEVAKQMRLRNLSGIIIVDFIDMVSKDDQKFVEKTLIDAVKKDRIKTIVVGMTSLGLMQITRKKTKPSLHRQMTTKCRQCDGTGSVPSIDWTVVRMRKEVEGILANTIYNHITVEADGRLLYAFAGKNNGYLQKLSDTFDGTVVCVANEEMGFGQFAIDKKKQN
ncbi:Rne/Rng family ribonuclease [Chakrabartyella piscis]|uniref:Rne/Rng family ribonuclease n=1 Tax=Chakrabartyella piscis TaxID=2918914 RepID=UPI0029587ACD|nr:Rne/Rng family ribonuclease [Chakrabartyella piscis]